MRLPFTRFKAFTALILLLALPILGRVSAVACENEPQLAVLKQSSPLDEEMEEEISWDVVSPHTFYFGDFVPEAIRAVSIRFTNLVPAYGGLNIFFSLIPVQRIIFPLYQPENFSVKPDFVGFLFRLKPF
jgi:hypothetical protein